MGVGICEKAIVPDIGGPIFGHFRFGVKPGFEAAIVGERGIRNFENQQDVLRPTNREA
jgi:hypothetical protein